MRSPAAMDIILADITNRCFLNCSNCTRLIAHQSKTEEMTPEQLRAALRSLRGWDAPGRVVGLIGGEPTVHSRFEEMCDVFKAEWRPGQDCIEGRNPIQDFDAFARRRLFDRGNGRGLWTSFGPRFRDHVEAINDTFSHWNPNDHTAGGLHQAALIHRDDYCAATGTTAQAWEAARDACWVQNLWSATINPHGAYPCEVMASIDRTFYGGKHAWKVEPGWWKREPKDFGDMLKLCDNCSLAQRGPSSVDARDRDIVSDRNRVALQLVGSPAIKGNRFDAYGPEHIAENRSVTTKDNYTAGPRVAVDNPHVRPKKLSAITVCVGRAEHLRLTLPHNLKLVDELIVVTTEDDVETQRVLGENPEAVTVISNRCHEGGDAFNLGKIQNDGLRRLAPGHDWILWVTCDVFLNPGLREHFYGHSWNPGVLYGVPRHDHGNGVPETIAETGLWPAENTNKKNGPLAGINTEPNGYFALWHPRASALAGREWPVMPETFCSAGGVDSFFLQRWPRDKRVIVPELACVHIAHEAHLGDGWNGNRAGWRQCGMICPSGQYVATEELSGTGPHRLRLTETRDGESVEIEVADGTIPQTIVDSNGKGGLLFCGLDIGEEYHVHVAYYRE